MDQETAVLQLENATRTHGTRSEVDHCSARLYAGEIVGLVGPNGAGKTTLIKLIIRHLHLDEGSIRVMGIETTEMEHHPEIRVSAILGNAPNYGYMSGMDHLIMTARMYPEITREQMLRMVDTLGLKNCINQKVHTYSSRQKYMLAVAQALLPKPQVLILDEPTDGLDPVGIKELRDILKRVAESGVLVMVSSHILSEVDMLCTRIIIMKEGRFIADLSSHELLDPNRVRVHIRVGQPDRAFEILESLFDDATVRLDGDELIVTGENLQVPQMNRTLIFNEVDVYEISVNREPLEEYFMELIKESGEEGGQDND